MKRVARWLVYSFMLVATGSVLATFLVFEASLPQLDGEIFAVQISAAVRIERDAIGIPTVIADNRADLAFGTGFVHGQDRFFQMDLSRRQSAGELADIIGPAVVEVDKRNRVHRFRNRASIRVSRMTAEESKISEAYVAGVNAGLDSLAAKPFEYFILGASPEPWRREDTVLVVYAMFMVLNDERASRDIKRGIAHRILSAIVYDWMYPAGTKWDAPLVGDARLPAEIPSADQFSIRDRVQTVKHTSLVVHDETPIQIGRAHA